jgi:5-methylcytosine-specific restriction endonuclease McrA
MSVKKCSVCRETLDVDCFGIDRRKKDGRNRTCKPCRSKQRKAATARLSESEYQERLHKQRETQRLWKQKAGVREVLRERTREQKRRIRSTEEGRRKNAESVKRWRERNPEDWRALRTRAFSQRKAAKLSSQSTAVSTAEVRKILSRPCVNCGERENLHLDHIIPLSRGGRHSIGNLQPLCQYCNLSKNNLLQIEWRRRMGKVGLQYVETGLS